MNAFQPDSSGLRNPRDQIVTSARRVARTKLLRWKDAILVLDGLLTYERKIVIHKKIIEQKFATSSGRRYYRVMYLVCDFLHKRI